MTALRVHLDIRAMCIDLPLSPVVTLVLLLRVVSGSIPSFLIHFTPCTFCLVLVHYIQLTNCTLDWAVTHCEQVLLRK